MHQEKNKFEVNKNIKDLEYRKLLNEYNAWLFAEFSVGLGLLVFTYNVTSSLIYSLLSSILVILLITQKVDEKSDELNNKINEIKYLAKYV